MISAKRLIVLYSINKENFLLPLISMKRLRGKTLSNFGKKQWSTQIHRADASSASRRSRCAVFTKTKGIVIEILSGSKSRSWKSVRKHGNESDIKSMVDETSKYTIYVLNSVFKHCTRKLWRNINAKNTLDYISTWQKWFMRHSSVEKSFWRTSSCPVSHWTRNWTTFDKEKQNIYEKYDSKRMQKQDSTFYSEGIAQNWSPRESRTCFTIESISHAAEAHQISWSKDWKSKIWDSSSSKRSIDNPRFTELLR